MVLLAFFPRLALWIPHIELIRPFVFILVPVSVVYGFVWIYRQGMKQARNK